MPSKAIIIWQLLMNNVKMPSKAIIIWQLLMNNVKMPYKYISLDKNK